MHETKMKKKCNLRANMNYQIHFSTSMLTEDPLQAPYINATLYVKVRQMWCLASMQSKRLLLCNVNKGTMVFQPILHGFPCFPLSFLFIFQMTLKPLSFSFTLTLTLPLSQNQTRWPPYNLSALQGHPLIQTLRWVCLDWGVDV